MHRRTCLMGPIEMYTALFVGLYLCHVHFYDVNTVTMMATAD